MRKLFAVVALSAALALAQSRVDTFTVVEQERSMLVALPDGGCSAYWCGRAVSADGGVTHEACTPATDLRQATNRTRCTGILAAGAGRLARELRFDVADAGAP